MTADAPGHSARDELRREIADRLGVVPNFFCSADAAPELMAEFWRVTKSLYLDNPLSSLFKERLVVYLSRFSRARYCIVRHAGFLLGYGRPAGDPAALPETVAQVLDLLRRPVPEGPSLAACFDRLERVPFAASLPPPRTEFEADLFDALSIMFLQPASADRARAAVLHAVGDSTFEWLIGYLTFIRASHYWTEMHPALSHEPDVEYMLRSNPELAALLLDPSDSELVYSEATLRTAVDDLQRTAGALLDRENDLAQQEFLMRLEDALRPLVDAIAVQTLSTQLVEEQVGATSAVLGEVAQRTQAALERARAATAHRRDEANLAFLAEVSQDLARLKNVDDTINGLCAKIGAYLHTIHCDVALADEEKQTVTVTHEWTQGNAPSLIGTHRMDAFQAEEFRQAMRAGRICVVRDTAQHPLLNARNLAGFPIGAFVSVPVTRDGKRCFTLSIFDRAPRDWRTDEIELLREVTAWIWTRLERARAEDALRLAHARLEQRVLERTTALERANVSLRDENRERRAAELQIKSLFQRLLAVQEEERRRLARNIHDELGQQMTALRMNLEMMRMRDGADPAARSAAIARTAQLAEELDRSLDFLTWELRPATLDHLGLAPALSNLAETWSERMAIAAEFEALDTEALRLPHRVEVNLYRIAQEALQNVVKHAKATRVAISLQHDERTIFLVIEDNGLGFAIGGVPERPASDRLGIVSMKERAALIGGTLDIESEPGRGTTIFVRVPMEAMEATDS